MEKIARLFLSDVNWCGINGLMSQMFAKIMNAIATNVAATLLGLTTLLLDLMGGHRTR